MALFIKQNQQRTELQEKLAAELQEKARKKSESADLPDGVEDSQFIKGTKPASKTSWIWLIVAVVLIGIVILLGINSASASI